MLKKISIDEISRKERVIMMVIMAATAVAGLKLGKSVFSWLLLRLYELFIQRNIVNL